MTYEVWDLISKNLIDFFEERHEVADTVQAYVDAGEAEEILLLEYDDTDADSSRSLTGTDLVRWLDDDRAARRRTA